jgi:hypothetical protein
MNFLPDAIIGSNKNQNNKLKKEIRKNKKI